jgi:hypothetical protein
VSLSVLAEVTAARLATGEGSLEEVAEAGRYALRSIAAFRARCEFRQETDLDDLWALLDDIEAALVRGGLAKAELPRCGECGERIACRDPGTFGHVNEEGASLAALDEDHHAWPS